MESFLDELWYGNLYPNTDCRVLSGETRELMRKLADCHEQLFNSLSNRQKEVLEKFDDCYAELTDRNERDIFSYAFCLGARFAIEVWLFDHT